MKVTSNINVFFNLLKLKNPLELKKKTYYAKNTKADLRILKKLEDLNLIKNLKEDPLRPSYYTYEIFNLRNLKIEKNPIVKVNRNNYARCRNLYLRNDALSELLISTSNKENPIMTLKESKDKNLGGFIIGRYVKRYLKRL